jgi:hypothetical protein
MVRIACLVLFLLAGVAANAMAADFNVLDKYARHDAGDRLNTPQGEIVWLKNQFKHGELKDFPARAIILHRAEVEKYLKAAGFGGFYTSFTFGFTDPKVIYVVRKPGAAPFAVARGLPGAGGVTLLAGMLHAMGTNTIIHVGTCGLLSPEVPYGRLIISGGSWRDGAAFLLDDRPAEQISRPDGALTRQITEVAAREGVALVRATGFTMPIYFYQPASMVRDLLAITGPDRPAFIEMEQAPLFSIARHMGMRAASIVVGSDRLETRDGKLVQGYWKGDLDALELSAFRLAVKAIAPAAR